MTAEVRKLIATGVDELAAADFLKGGDPAVNIVKTLTVKYTLGGQPQTASAVEGEALKLPSPWH